MEKRQEIVHRFQHDPHYRVIIMSNAGSTGLNLQAAITVINVDLPWNPADLEQQIARAHRMGQKRQVQVYLLVTEDTIEERLLGTLSAKHDLALAALDVESDVSQVELRSGMEELKRRLERLLGERPATPIDVSQQRAVEAETQQIAARREKVAAAGGELLGAAIKLLGELVDTGGNEPAPQTVDQVRAGLDRCVDRDENGNAADLFPFTITRKKNTMKSKQTVARPIIVLASLLAATALPSPAAEPHSSLPQPGTVDGLGVNIHFTDPRPGEMEMLADGGFRWVRMDLTWGRTEPEKGRYDFSAYDRLLAALQRHKIRALFILDYSNPLYEKERSVTTEQGRQAYARWAAAAAGHFRGQGILWEIWNEPNIRGFWQPEPNVADYTAMALAAARAIRSVAPGEAIIGPATSTIDLEFLEGCFQAGLLQWWDAVSVHPYRRAAPETAVVEYHRLRRLIDRYAPADKSLSENLRGLAHFAESSEQSVPVPLYSKGFRTGSKSIPIISGEWGYSAAWDGFDPVRQGKLLPRQWLTNLSQDIPVSIWYDWHDDGPDPDEPEHHFGTVENQEHRGREPVYDPKPAYLAAKTLTTTLAGYRFCKRIATGGQTTYALLFRKDDQQRLAVWTTGSEPSKIQIPSRDARFERISHTGETLASLSATSGILEVTVTDEPQYLIAATPQASPADAPAAHALHATVAVGPGRLVAVQVDNLENVPFQGMVRLVDVSGIDPVRSAEALQLPAAETHRSVEFPLTARPRGECQVGLRIESREGHLMYEVPTTRVAFVPDDLLTSCRAVADGDPQVACEASVEVAEAPQPLPDSDASVVRIRYAFDDGWKFLRLVPDRAETRAIACKPTGFAFWIFGDGGGTSPRLRVRDTTGQTWQPSGPAIDWQGWRYVQLPLTTSTGHWGGAEDGTIHCPLVWDSLFLLDNPSRRQNQGSIYIAAPMILY